MIADSPSAGRVSKRPTRLMRGIYGSATAVSLQPRKDPESGLPLLSAGDEVLKLALNYLPLPYLVVEYGCGQKAGILLNLLSRSGIPGYALHRGMILEPDLSPEALAETDPGRRMQPLRLANPLFDRVRLSDKMLVSLFAEAGIEVDAARSEIRAGTYTLHHKRKIQFVRARSHIFCVISFWDEDNRQVTARVLDPTLEAHRLLEVEELRTRLEAPEALLFLCPLLGRFRLAPEWLTKRQRWRIEGLLPERKALGDISWRNHAQLVQRLTGAARGTLGDPDTWSYANNVPGHREEKHRAAAGRRTGTGEPLRRLARRLATARESDNEAALIEERERFLHISRELKLPRVLEEDARRAEKALAPLARVMYTISYTHSLRSLGAYLQNGNDLASLPADDGLMVEMHGLGVRLRTRIGALTRVSKDDRGRIDARALNRRYFQAARETIRQMTWAGLTVFIDRVGNIHGLSMDEESLARLRSGNVSVSRWTRGALAFVSHIDTVFDAGEFDGRLGVMSGIETLHLLADLERWFGIRLNSAPGARTMVTVFLGEEMTYTGENVSLPGSAAVAGQATPEQIYRMTNAEGDQLGNQLVLFLRYLRRCADTGAIELMNTLSGDDGEALLAACYEPTDFFTPHTYERHIEQGPMLDRAGIPAVLAAGVMGIRKEDFRFCGERAEAAALEFNRRLSALTERDDLRGIRVTAGILRPLGEVERAPAAGVAWRVTLRGRQDHSGATAMEDRRDPGVAAGRLARAFAIQVDALRRQHGEAFTPIIGDVVLTPGTNRNVIPQLASLTLGVCQSLPHEVAEKLRRGIEDTIQMLAKDRAAGGEGVELDEFVACTDDGIRLSSEVLISTDTRGADDAMLSGFRRHMDEVLGAIGAGMGVTWKSAIIQKASPIDLADSGQVLQIERSFGGSHNPYETAVPRDLLRGQLLQLAVTERALRPGALEHAGLFGIASAVFPKRWTGALGPFVSGAVHDTCNIARARLEPSLRETK